MKKTERKWCQIKTEWKKNCPRSTREGRTKQTNKHINN